MDRKVKIYIALFVLGIASILYAEYTKPKPINWFPSFASHHTIPYGTYILKKELSSLFPSTSIQEIVSNPYEFLADDQVAGTYIFINDVINMGEEEFNRLMNFVERGNDVFVSTQSIQVDTFKIHTRRLFSASLVEKTLLTLENKRLALDSLRFAKTASHHVFEELDTLKSTVLGTLAIESKDSIQLRSEVHFVKYQHGLGSFYFHTFPHAFTNYAILEGTNHAYVSSVLSYLDPKKPILLDAYYKSGKSKISSPMYYVLSSKNLKYAYYTVLIAILLFIIFKGKRDQRAIPIITPLVNQSVAFTRTIAMMFFEERAHKEIASHKIKFFLDYIRTTYQLSTEHIDANFYNQLAMRSQHDIATIKSLFGLMEYIQKQSSITQEEVSDLHQKIETFKHHTV